MATVANLRAVVSADIGDADRKLSAFQRRLDQTAGSARQAGGGVRGFFSEVGRGGVSLQGATSAALGFVGAQAAIGAATQGVRAIKAIVNGGADLVETMNKVQVTFGASAGTVTKEADRMARRFGYVRQTFLDAASGIGLIAKGAGLAAPAAARMGRNFARLAADVSSFYNVPVADALIAIRAGLVGEAEPLRRYGVLVNEAAVQQEALRLGVAKAGEKLTDQQKVIARASLITKGFSDASGDLARTQSSVANRLREIQGRITNAAADLGTKALPAIAAIINGGFEAAGALGRVATTVGRELAPGFRDLVSAGANIRDALSDIARAGEPVARVLGPAVLGAGVVAFRTLAGAVESASTVLAALSGFLADHRGIVVALATVYGASLIPTLTQTVGLFGLITAARIKDFFLNAASAAGSLITTLRAQGVSTFATAVSGLAVGLGILYEGFSRNARQADSFAAKVAGTPRTMDQLRVAIHNTATEGERLMGVAGDRRLVSFGGHALYASSSARKAADEVGALAERNRELFRTYTGAEQVIARVSAATGLSAQAVERLAQRTKGGLVPALEELVAQHGGRVGPAVRALTKGLEEEASKLRGATPAAEKLTTATETLGDESATATDQIKAMKDALDALIGVHVDAVRADLRYRDAVKDLAASLKDEGGASLDANTEAGARNLKAVLDVVDATTSLTEALGNQGATTDALRSTFSGHVDQLRAVLLQTGANKGEVDALIGALGLLDGTKAFPEVRPSPTIADTLRQVGQLGVAVNNLNAVQARPKVVVEGADKVHADLAAIERHIANLGANVRQNILTLTTGPAPNQAQGTNSRLAPQAVANEATGGLLRRSGPENHIAQVVPANTIRVWSEPETGGEAYIPLAPHKRRRSTRVLSEVASDFGFGLVPMAEGGFLHFADGGQRRRRGSRRGLRFRPGARLDPSQVSDRRGTRSDQLLGLWGPPRPARTATRLESLVAGPLAGHRYDLWESDVTGWVVRARARGGFETYVPAHGERPGRWVPAEEDGTPISEVLDFAGGGIVRSAWRALTAPGRAVRRGAEDLAAAVFGERRVRANVGLEAGGRAPFGRLYRGGATGGDLYARLDGAMAQVWRAEGGWIRHAGAAGDRFEVYRRGRWVRSSEDGYPLRGQAEVGVVSFAFGGISGAQGRRRRELVRRFGPPTPPPRRRRRRRAPDRDLVRLVSGDRRPPTTAEVIRAGAAPDVTRDISTPATPGPGATQRQRDEWFDEMLRHGQEVAAARRAQAPRRGRSLLSQVAGAVGDLAVAGVRAPVETARMVATDLYRGGEEAVRRLTPLPERRDLDRRPGEGYLAYLRRVSPTFTAATEAVEAPLRAGAHIDELIAAALPGGRGVGQTHYGRAAAASGIVSTALGDVLAVAGTVGGAHAATARFRALPGHAAEALATEGGFSLRPFTGEAPPPPGAMVSLFGTEQRLPGLASPAEIAAYRRRNLGRLARPGRFLGGWVEEGATFLDVSRRYPDLAEGLAAGRAQSQLGIFDLAAGRTERPFGPGPEGVAEVAARRRELVRQRNEFIGRRALRSLRERQDILGREAGQIGAGERRMVDPRPGAPGVEGRAGEALAQARAARQAARRAAESENLIARAAGRARGEPRATVAGYELTQGHVEALESLYRNAEIGLPVGADVVGRVLGVEGYVRSTNVLRQMAEDLGLGRALVTHRHMAGLLERLVGQAKAQGMPTRPEVTGFIADLTRRYPAIDFHLQPKAPHVWDLAEIHTLSGARPTDALRFATDLTRWADTHGITLTGDASPVLGTARDRLERLYRRFGGEATGRPSAYPDALQMERRPRGQARVRVLGALRERLAAVGGEAGAATPETLLGGAPAAAAALRARLGQRGRGLPVLGAAARLDVDALRTRSAIEELLQGRYPDVRVSLHEADDEITFNQLVVPPEARSQGVGSAVMGDLVAYADATGKRVALTPSTALGGSSVERLERFYGRFGFEPNASDLTTAETMVRPPRGGPGAAARARAQADVALGLRQRAAAAVQRRRQAAYAAMRRRRETFGGERGSIIPAGFMSGIRAQSRPIGGLRQATQYRLNVAMEEWAEGGNEAIRRDLLNYLGIDIAGHYRSEATMEARAAWMRGSAAQRVRRGRALLNAAERGTPTDMPLYRGMRLSQRLFERFVGPAEFEIPLAGFSSQEHTARAFAQLFHDEVKRGADLRSLTIALEPGAPALSLADLADYGPYTYGFADEAEHLVSGRFEVLDIEEHLNRQRGRRVSGPPGFPYGTEPVVWEYPATTVRARWTGLITARRNAMQAALRRRLDEAGGEWGAARVGALSGADLVAALRRDLRRGGRPSRQARENILGEAQAAGFASMGEMLAPATPAPRQHTAPTWEQLTPARRRAATEHLGRFGLSAAGGRGAHSRLLGESILTGLGAGPHPRVGRVVAPGQEWYFRDVEALGFPASEADRMAALASEYGVPFDVAAAVQASQSPQVPFGVERQVARRVFEHVWAGGDPEAVIQGGLRESNLKGMALARAWLEQGTHPLDVRIPRIGRAEPYRGRFIPGTEGHGPALLGPKVIPYYGSYVDPHQAHPRLATDIHLTTGMAGHLPAEAPLDPATGRPAGRRSPRWAPNIADLRDEDLFHVLASQVASEAAGEWGLLPIEAQSMAWVVQRRRARGAKMRARQAARRARRGTMSMARGGITRFTVPIQVGVESRLESAVPAVAPTSGVGAAAAAEIRQAGGTGREIGRNWQSIVAFLDRRHVPYRVTSTTGGRHVPGSLHYAGKAADLVGPDNMAIAKTLDSQASSLAELFYTPLAHSVKGGRRVVPPIAAAGHYSHVHAATFAEGGMIGPGSTVGTGGGALDTDAIIRALERLAERGRGGSSSTTNRWEFSGNTFAVADLGSLVAQMQSKARSSAVGTAGNH